VIKVVFVTLLTFFLFSCSFNENSKVWNQQNNFENKKNLKKVFVENEKTLQELNPFLKLNLSQTRLKNYSDNNNFGTFNYLGYLNKVASFKFSKFNDLKKINFKPILLENGLIFFDKNGSIIKYNYAGKIIWKKNYYSKYDKKLSPKLDFSISNNYLVVADDVAKVHLLDISSGDLIWSINATYPVNSEIIIHKEKFFLIDYENTLKCYYLKDGSTCWSLQTEKTFTISESKNSLIINDGLIIFSNSIGDITSVDISTGLIEWQLPTQNNEIIDKTYNFEISKLVNDKNFIYFSNNKNQIYSINIKNGIINWTNKVNSILSPVIVGDYIFTISNEGYLFTIQKNSGNIIKINDIYKFYKNKKRKNIRPIGFVIGNNNIYLTNNDGKIIVIELITGNIINIQHISKKPISKPFIYNESLFVIRNGSVNQYN